MDGNPVGDQKPVGFKFAFNFRETGILFFLKFDPMLDEDSLQAAVRGTGFGGFGLFNYFIDRLLFAKKV